MKNEEHNIFHLKPNNFTKSLEKFFKNCNIFGNKKAPFLFWTILWICYSECPGLYHLSTNASVTNPKYVAQWIWGKNTIWVFSIQKYGKFGSLLIELSIESKCWAWIVRNATTTIFTEGCRHYNLLWVCLLALFSFFSCLRIFWRLFYLINPIKFLCQRPKLFPQPSYLTKNLDYIFPKLPERILKKLEINVTGIFLELSTL